MQANSPQTMRHATPTATHEPTTRTQTPAFVLPPEPALLAGGRLWSPSPRPKPDSTFVCFSEGTFVKCGLHQYGVEVGPSGGCVAGRSAVGLSVLMGSAGWPRALLPLTLLPQSGVRCAPVLAGRRGLFLLWPPAAPNVSDGLCARPEDTDDEPAVASLIVLFKISEGGLIVVMMMDGLDPGRDDGTTGDAECSKEPKPVAAKKRDKSVGQRMKAINERAVSEDQCSPNRDGKCAARVPRSRERLCGAELAVT